MQLLKGRENSNWVFNNTIRFLQFQKEQVQQGEIIEGSLKNFLKAIKLLYRMVEIQSFGRK